MEVLNAGVRGAGGDGTGAYALHKVERGRYLVRSVRSGSDFELTVEHLGLATFYVTHTAAGSDDDIIEVPEGVLRIRVASGDTGNVLALVSVSIFPL